MNTVTSITGAVGVTALGPTSGKPLLVTSFADFVRKFGGFLPDPDSGIYNNWALDPDHGRFWQFPLSVKGYFDNGGQQLYVKRVFYEAAAELRRREGPDRRVAIIAMTADVMAGCRERCVEAGMDDFIAKPIKLEDLIGALRKWAPMREAKLV